MKDDEIVTIGKNADAYANNQTSDSFDWKLIRDARFAQLVAAAEREANARLIAAAPEMLEALKWYENQAKEMWKAAINSDSKRILELMQEIAVDYGKLAGAAIAKATGSTS